MENFIFPFANLDNNSLVNEILLPERNNLILPYHKYKNLVLSNPSVSMLEISPFDLSDETNQTLTRDDINCNYYDHNLFSNTLQSNHVECKVLFNNIRSAPKNFENFKVEVLNHILDKLNILGLCETRLTSATEDECRLDGFSIFTNNKTRRCGGVALLARSTLNCKKIPELSIMKPYLESIFIEHIDRGVKTIYGVIYRRQNTSNDDFLTEMYKMLNNQIIRCSRCIIMGDINYDMFQYDKCHSINDFANLLWASNFLIQTTRPTRVCSTVATLIDHIWSNFEFSNQLNGILMTEHSDHFSPFLLSETDSSSPSSKTTTVIHRNFKHSSEEDVMNVLLTKMESLPETDDVESNYHNFSKVLQESMNECFPYKHAIIKQKTLENSWMTNELLNAIKDKNKLYKKYLKLPITYAEEYKRLRNRVAHLTRDAKREYYNAKFDAAQGNSKKTWGVLNKLLNKKTKNKSHIKEIKTDGETITDPQLICNQLNTYFANIGMTNRRGINQGNRHFREYLQGDFRPFRFTPVTEIEIKNIIKKMKVSGAGSDEISMKLIKDGSEAVVPTLTKILNQSFAAGYYPNDLKKAKITPIFKGGDNSCMENYRQISILNSINKIFEKVVYKQLLHHAVENNIFTPCQYGFLKSVSTQDCILNFLKSVHENISKNNFTIGLFLDFCKAFDVINHEILLEKLEFYGINDTALQWIKSYLTGRTQYTVVNGCSSDPIGITHGVPQGSVLGPLFFLFFINDLPNCSEVLDFSIFADDSNATASSRDLFTLRETVIEELENISQWLLANRIQANLTKSHFLIFMGNRKVDFSLKIPFQGRNLKQKNSY